MADTVQRYTVRDVLYGAAATGDERDIVHAYFPQSGSRRLYHYTVAGASVGDKIRSPGMHSDHAIVVGHGRVGYTGPARQATIVGTSGIRTNWLGLDATSSPFTQALMESTIAKIKGDTPNMPNYKPQANGDYTIAQTEEWLRKAKKDRKKARKAEAERKAAIAEAARRRQVGLKALERIATQESGDAAVAAARALAEGV